MKVLCAAPYFWPRTGGMEVLAFSLQKALHINHGYEFLTVTSAQGHAEGPHSLNASSQVLRLPCDFKVFSTPIGLTWMRTLRTCIDDFRPDLVLAHTPVPVMADIAVRAARGKHIPSIVMYHGDISRDTFLKAIATDLYWNMVGRRTLQFCDGIFVTTRLYASRSENLKRYLDKVVVVPPFVDTSIFRPILPPTIRDDWRSKAQLQVMFVGQLERVNRAIKGLDTLLRAFVTVLKEVPGAMLVVVGDGSAKRDYAKTARSLGILEHVKFAGKLPHHEMPTAYSEADILCLPSTTNAESLGMVLLEAQACGIPVVASAVGGIPEVVRDRETGLLVRPGDQDSLASALCSLLKNQPLRQEMGEAAFRYVRSNFTDRAAANAANEAIMRITSHYGGGS